MVIDMKKTLKPSLRFKGFTDTWEQCEIGNLTDLYVGSSFTQELSDDGKFIVMDMGSVSQEGYRVELKRTDFERDMLKKDDLVMPKDDIGGGLIIGKTAHIPTENTHLLGDHVFRLRFIEEDGLFMHYLINTNNVNSSLKKKVTGSAQLGIRGVNVKNEVVSIPSVEEQAKIGHLFDNIDSLITLHQRKYDKLVNIKKALLDKMFPKNGELVPAIRFKGFTDTWELCKLGDIGTFKSNGVDKLSKPNEVPVNLLNYMDVYNRREINNENAAELMQVTAKKSQLIDNNVLKNDVFFTPTSETPDDIGRVYVIEETLNNTVYSYHLMRYRPKDGVFYPNFPNYSLMTSHVRQQFFISAKGVQRYVISKADFESIENYIPKYLEQTKIGEMFRSIDSLIALHQRKYEKLVNIKKSLLQKMFV